MPPMPPFDPLGPAEPTERLLRATLQAPEHRVLPGVGLLDRARLEGTRRRRRRRVSSVALSVTSMVAIIGTGAALSPHLFGKHYVVQPAAPGLRVDSSPPLALLPDQTSMWTEQVRGHSVDVVASWTAGRLCLRRVPATVPAAGTACARTSTLGWLLAGPVGGRTGVAQTDAAVSHFVVAGSRLLTKVGARLDDGDVIQGYQSDLPTGVRLFDMIVPRGIHVAGLTGTYAGAGVQADIQAGSPAKLSPNR